MSTSKLSYNDIIEQIKNNPPILDNPDETVRNIMLEIEHLKPIPKQNRVINILSRISGIAAAFLLGLFVHETFFIQNHSLQNSTTQHAEYSFENSHYNLSHLFEKSDFTEKNQIISAVISQKQQQSKDRRAFYSNIIMYSQNK